MVEVLETRGERAIRQIVRLLCDMYETEPMDRLRIMGPIEQHKADCCSLDCEGCQ